MSIELMNKLIYILPFVVASLILVFIVSLRNSVKYKNMVKTSYKRAERINKRNKLLNYESIETFIRTKGMKLHFGEWMNPTVFLLTEGMCIIAFSIIGSSLLGILGAVGGMLLGALAFPGLALLLNSSDEKKMIPEIAIVYNSLRVQIHSGAHVQEAISSCYKYLDEGRLRSGLYKLSEEIELSGELTRPLENFKNEFSFEPIYTLCMILEQGQKSGQMESLLGDITKQIENMQSFALAQRKGTLDRISTFCILAILASALGLILWQFIMVLMTNVTEI